MTMRRAYGLIFRADSRVRQHQHQAIFHDCFMMDLVICMPDFSSSQPWAEVAELLLVEVVSESRNFIGPRHAQHCYDSIIYRFPLFVVLLRSA